MEDQYIWMYSWNGDYTVKSGYNAIYHWNIKENQSTASSSGKQKVWKNMWTTKTIPRHQEFMWRVLNESLPVKSELSKRGIRCNILCPICNNKIETIDHILKDCVSDKKIWFGSKLGLNFDQSNASFKDWLEYMINTQKDDDITYIGAIAYGIWMARNQKVFEDIDTPEMITILRAEASIRDYTTANQKSKSTQGTSRNQESTIQNHRQGNNKWQKPYPNRIKANCDANLNQKSTWGLGAIFRDENGEVLAAATWRRPSIDNPLMAEAMALYQTVKLARDCCFGQVDFESDNANLVRLLKEDETPRSRNYLGSILKGIKESLRTINGATVRHIGRNGNSTAHELARLANIMPNTVWIEEIPNEIVSTYISDLIQ